MTTPKSTTLLYADIVGYTALIRADKDNALAKLEYFKALMQSQTQAYQGEVIQLHRDYCIAAFERAADAVACAEALQMNFKAEPTVPVRMGIHAGEVIVENGNAFGEGVFQVTQIEKIAIAGSIVLSKEIQAQLADKAQFALESLGAFTFKNVDNPIELFALTNDGLSVPESCAELREEQKQANRKRWLRALQLFAGYLVAAWTNLKIER
ncbi:MAG: adenylate/guanylate cyclase domain-containing protein [Saprospiraceae bacterium]|nr:adenylate/guanylate cyclase domain-containing protein [Saprospiraceae bacterium]